MPVLAAAAAMEAAVDDMGGATITGTQKPPALLGHSSGHLAATPSKEQTNKPKKRGGLWTCGMSKHCL